MRARPSLRKPPTPGLLANSRLGPLTDRARRLKNGLRDSVHLETVVRVLAAGGRAAVDRVRRDVETPRRSGLQPSIIETKSRIPRRPVDGKGTKRQVGGGKQGDINTSRIGRVGETWARAAVLDALLRLSDQDRSSAIDQIREVLADRFSGRPVEQALEAADAFLSAADDDDASEALIRFVHVSQTSDGFGFDLLGWFGPRRLAATAATGSCSSR